MQKLETKFKEKVQADLRTLKKKWFIKTQEVGRRGVPDILMCLGGKFFAIELKTEVGALDKLQMFTLELIAKSGGSAYTVTPSTWAGVFESLKKEEKANDPVEL